VVVLAQDEARELTTPIAERLFATLGFTDPATEASRYVPALDETNEGRH
jgi:hypothetical protein